MPSTLIGSAQITIAGLLLATGITLASDAELEERPEWKKHFDQFDAKGTIVIIDERPASKAAMVFNSKRAEKRHSPASTFKIPHALFALETGVVRDEFQIFPWDGNKRSISMWNRDQDLRSSMRNSVVWVYELIAEQIGAERERAFMKKIGYGNADPTGDAPFWIDGNLRISAVEQVAFLKKLYRNKLPFKIHHQRLVKDVMIIEAGCEWILRGKTGWSGTLGWWVGWVEHPEGAVFFALNIDTPKRLDDLPKREGITRAILAELGALKKLGPDRASGSDAK